MAIRVRKLAKELGRSAGEVLGLLHHLGFRRYTKPDDMVNDAIASKARKGRGIPRRRRQARGRALTSMLRVAPRAVASSASAR